jgi:hypothetical protein
MTSYYVESLSKVECKECHWQGQLSQVLKAENPFEPGQEIHGCPECRSPCSFEYCCEWHDCWKPASSGTPSKDGYKHTCFDHRPPVEQL